MGSVTYHPLCYQNIYDGTSQVPDVFNQVHGLETSAVLLFCCTVLMLVVSRPLPIERL
jgi:hypothetical protein